MKKRTGLLCTLGALVLILFLCEALYVQSYYHASPEAAQALVSDGNVAVEKRDYGWFFDGPGQEDALIFYPGGKVEETAYAPLLHALASEGMDVCLVKMPLRLAVLSRNKAERAKERKEWSH